jgi:Aspartyl/Asparaginyl beta-hydroxylase
MSANAMKLPARFIQLPLLFDVGVLAAEIASVRESEWMDHPAGYAGNSFLPLIAAHGDPSNQGFDGPMRPTPFLSEARPYLRETLGALGAVLGRTRLMRLTGHAEVSEHSDVNYYWRERMRVHVPIITQPNVRFYCGDQETHMAAGECWVFDTWSLHRVVNDQTESRVHLVVDTVGGEGMQRLLAAGWRSGAPQPPGWAPRKLAPAGGAPQLLFETVNFPAVMSPWELREHITFLLSEAVPGQAGLADVARVSLAFVQRWRALWAAYGESEAGWPRYRAALNQYVQDLKAVRAHQLALVNDVDFFETFVAMVLTSALHDAARAKTPPEIRSAEAAGVA